MVPRGQQLSRTNFPTAFLEWFLIFLASPVWVSRRFLFAFPNPPPPKKKRNASKTRTQLRFVSRWLPKIKKQLPSLQKEFEAPNCSTAPSARSGQRLHARGHRGRAPRSLRGLCRGRPSGARFWSPKWLLGTLKPPVKFEGYGHGSESKS